RVTNLPTRYQLIVPCTVPLTPVSVAVKLPESTSATSSDDAIGLPPPQESVPPTAKVPEMPALPPTVTAPATLSESSLKSKRNGLEKLLPPSCLRNSKY